MSAMASEIIGSTVGSGTKTSKLRITGLCNGNSLVTGEFPEEKASSTKMFPFDDVIMTFKYTGADMVRLWGQLAEILLKWYLISLII